MSARSPQIIAMGGGGFLMEPENPALERYILAQTGAERPRVAYLGQAKGENPYALAAFYRALTELGAHPAHLSLFEPHTADVAGFLLAQDVIYVGGGNTKSLLALWREWGLDTVLRQAWRQGTVLCGVSAGSICWFEQGVTDSIPGPYTALPCLGFLPGSNCPHYDGEAERRPRTHALLREGALGPGLAADDGVALHFVGTELHATVTSRPKTRAWRYGLEAGEVVETPLDPTLLRA